MPITPWLCYSGGVVSTSQLEVSVNLWAQGLEELVEDGDDLLIVCVYVELGTDGVFALLRLSFLGGEVPVGGQISPYYVANGVALLVHLQG